MWIFGKWHYYQRDLKKPLGESAASEGDMLKMEIRRCGFSHSSQNGHECEVTSALHAKVLRC